MPAFESISTPCHVPWKGYTLCDMTWRLWEWTRLVEHGLDDFFFFFYNVSTGVRSKMQDSTDREPWLYAQSGSG